MMPLAKLFHHPRAPARNVSVRSAAGWKPPCGDLRRAIASVLVAVAVATAGCVSRGGYDQALRERDVAERQKSALSARIEQLDLSISNLNTEVKDLTGQLEDVEEERDGVRNQLEELRETHAEVGHNLELTEAELARRSSEVKELHGTYDALVADLESEVAAGQIEIRQLRDGLQVNVPDRILFASGSAQLSAEGSNVLRRVAKQLVPLPNRIQVLGHSDDRKVRESPTSRYATNWELAGARAAAVVRVFREVGVPGERLAAVSRGEFAPVASNETEEERALNRRIEILLLPDAPGSPRPTAESAAPPP